MIRRLAPLGMVLIALAVSGWSGCELFKPAEPEKQPPGSTIIPNNTSIDSTLSTMAKGIGAKDNSGGLNAYMGSLAEPAADSRSFYAEFDPLTVSMYQGTGGTVPNVWGRNEEQRYYQTFARADGQPHQLVWINDVGSDIGDPAADTGYVVFRHYDVQLIQADGTPRHVAYGRADLYFMRSGTRWVMWRWVDHEEAPPPARAPADGSYGTLRLRNQ